MKNLKNMIIAISMLICAQGAYALSNGKELFDAVNGDNAATVKQLLNNKNIDIDWANKDGLTPLMAAAMHGNAEIIALLLAAGANPEKKVGGFRAINLITSPQKTKAFQLLYKATK